MNTRYLTLAIFVTVTLASLVGLAWTLGALPRAGKAHSVRLADAAGLVEGNAVRIAGVQVGQIRRISVDGNEAVLELKMNPEVAIFEEACASPQMKGLLGEKFLQIRQPRSGRELAAGAPIQCIDPSVDIGEALNSMSGVVDSEESLYGPVTRIIKRFDGMTAALDKEGLPRERLDKLLADVEEMTGEAKAMIKENREDLRAIVKATRALVENPKIGRMIDNGDATLAMLRREAPGLVESGKALFSDGERALGKLEAVIDAVEPGKVRSMVDDGAAALVSLRKAADELAPVAKAMAPLVRNLGKLVDRAVAIDEKTIRQFFQIEGFRVRLAVPYGVRGKVKDLVEEEPQP